MSDVETVPKPSGHPFGGIGDRCKLVLLGTPMSIVFGAACYLSITADKGDGSLRGIAINAFLSSIVSAFFSVSSMAVIGSLLPSSLASLLSDKIVLPVVRRAWLAIIALFAIFFLGILINVAGVFS